MLLLAAAGVLKAQPQTVEGMLLDATYVPCSDSSESLFIYRDGRAIYALYDQGVMFDVGSSMMSDLEVALQQATSVVDTTGLDSCNTVGVVLAGPRYLLINNRRPAEATRDLQRRLERLRKYGRRKLEGMDRLILRAERDADSVVLRDVSIDLDALRQKIAPSSIAREWGCRGSVVVSVRIAYDGRLRSAFVEEARARGKCAALLTATALRAVIQTPFEPALGADGKPTASWIRVELVINTR